MQRDGLLLGVIATGGQVLILRELISSLQGDELFIGTALCGWLLWGAVGAYWGGKRHSVVSNVTLFAPAALILPIVIIIARLSPLIITRTVGEALSFTYAASLSFIITLPGALVCGYLFAAIVRRDGNYAACMLRIYYSEGVGAFVAGALVSILTSNNVSTLSTAGVLSCASLAALSFRSHLSGFAKVLGAAAAIAAGLAVITAGPLIDRTIDRYKYRPYEVTASFDTPYSHQTILQRGGAHVLLTDNMVESTESDILTAENFLLPPLAYVSNAKDILVFGQMDLTLPPLLENLPNLSITEVDMRPPLHERVRKLSYGEKSFRYIQNDPVAFLRLARSGSFDAVILPLDESGSYRGLRLMTGRALADIRRVLRPHGVLHLVTTYNSEEYVLPDDKQLFSTIRATLEAVFPRVIVWPGSSTLFLAGDSTLAISQPDSIAARLNRLNYRPQFLNESYLPDRLSKWQVERINNALRMSCEANSFDHPSLANLQIIRRSSAYVVDRWVQEFMRKPSILGAIMMCVAVSLLGFSAVGRRRKWFGLGLYFTAGLVSLNLELISFYVYQSIAGILYSRLSLLVGSFMLGLAVGARITTVIRSKLLASATLALLAATTLIFMATCMKVPPDFALPYHVALQFVVAFCTGSLFVAATRYYYGETTGHGGIGYAIELAGSSLSALVTMPLLLPAVGLKWLLMAVAILTGLLFIRAVVDIRSASSA
jgi:SAM-dependent methyltransferase